MSGVFQNLFILFQKSEQLHVLPPCTPPNLPPNLASRDLGKILVKVGVLQDELMWTSGN